MDINNFANLIENYYGYKIHDMLVNEDSKVVECILYKSFAISFSIGDRYGVFGATLSLGSQSYSLVDIFGKKVSLNSDEESILKNLKIIDEYCRLRLPDKFLDAYDQAYK